MAGLIIVGAYIAFPLPASPVPVVLQNFFVILAGLLLGPVWGAASVALYLALGALGLPVFAGGAGGLSVFAGPTGGYLVGFLPAAVVAGGVARLGQASIWKDAVGALAGAVLIFAVGVPWLKTVAELDWPAALAAGLLPFIVGDVFKVIASVLVAQAVRPAFEKLRRS
jgi:biotin transport system substrate-specific component